MLRVHIADKNIALLPKSLALIVPGFVYSLAHDAATGATCIVVAPVEPQSVTLATFASVDEAVANFKRVCVYAETYRLENESVERMNETFLAMAAAVPLNDDDDAD